MTGINLAYPCFNSKNGCPHPAKYYLVFAWQTNCGPQQLVSQFRVCEVCKVRATRINMLTDDVYKLICNQFSAAAMAPPPQNQCTLEFQLMNPTEGISIAGP